MARLCVPIFSHQTSLIVMLFAGAHQFVDSPLTVSAVGDFVSRCLSILGIKPHGSTIGKATAAALGVVGIVYFFFYNLVAILICV